MIMDDGPPRRALVTGCAGFIGSTLCERLLDEGCDVVGIDNFTDFYSADLKLSNLAELRERPGFELHELDLACDDFAQQIEGVETIFHLAARAGVRGSFGADFNSYVRDNVVATQRLFEAAVRLPLTNIVYASSSSVYGTAERMPTPEDVRLQPVSPYGVTKLAAESLADMYFRTTGLSVVGLRYFTVYGPRQRPDMAFSRFIDAALAGRPITVYGNGRQTRDFTFVDDAVTATIAAATRGRPGRVYNIGGGSPVRLNSAIRTIAGLLGRRIEINYTDPARGDAEATCADGGLALEELGFVPSTSVRSGLTQQVAWALGRSDELAYAA